MREKEDGKGGKMEGRRRRREGGGGEGEKGLA